MSCSISAATLWACERSLAQRQKRTSPPSSPCSGSASRSGLGATTAAAASSTRWGLRWLRSSTMTGACGWRSRKSRRFLPAAPRERQIASSSLPAGEQVPVLAREQVDERHLREARVLIVVDEHVPEPRGGAREHVGALAQQRARRA